MAIGILAEFSPQKNMRKKTLHPQPLCCGKVGGRESNSPGPLSYLRRDAKLFPSRRRKFSLGTQRKFHPDADRGKSRFSAKQLRINFTFHRHIQKNLSKKTT